MEAKEYIASMVEKSRIAQRQLEKMSQEQLDAMARAIGKVVFDNAEYFARLAVDETRMGKYEDKIKKNQGKSKIIWNSLKGKKTTGIIRRDEEAGIIEIARPVGVVGAVTPCTNPIVTPMCNAMFAIKGANTIIIGPHPRAKKCSKIVIDMFNAELAKLGAPENTIQLIEEPTVELSAELMKAVDVVVATGGMPMVRSAYSSGKPAYGVGAGNVQCIIDRGMDIKDVASKVIAGREFDNGIICSGEQTIIVPEEEYDSIIAEFKAQGCYYIEDEEEVSRFSTALFPEGKMNKDLVGVSALKVAEAAGIKVPADTRVILVKALGYGKGYVFSKEKMCPVISTYTYKTFEEAVDIAQANLDVEGRGHSVSLHSNNKEHVEYAGERLTVARVLINQICSTMNGGSFLNSLAPTTTLGCCSWGGNSISENFSYKHLLNVIRIAYPKPNAVVPTDEEVWG